MKKIGFIALAHPDYISDGRAKEFAERAVGVAEKNGYRAVFSGRLACDTEAALRDALEILRSDVCGTVLFLASWLECPVAMTAVKELCGMPLFLWGFPMWEEDGREMSTGSYVSYAMFRGVLSRIGHSECRATGRRMRRFFPSAVQHMRKSVCRGQRSGLSDIHRCRSIPGHSIMF